MPRYEEVKVQIEQDFSNKVLSLIECELYKHDIQNLKPESEN